MNKKWSLLKYLYIYEHKKNENIMHHQKLNEFEKQFESNKIYKKYIKIIINILN
jgi:hypothetical protein